MNSRHRHKKNNYKLPQEFKEFKEGTAKQLNEIMEQELMEKKCLSDIQENTNIRLIKVTRQSRPSKWNAVRK